MICVSARTVCLYIVFHSNITQCYGRGDFGVGAPDSPRRFAYFSVLAYWSVRHDCIGDATDLRSCPIAGRQASVELERKNEQDVHACSGTKHIISLPFYFTILRKICIPFHLPVCLSRHSLFNIIVVHIIGLINYSRLHFCRSTFSGYMANMTIETRFMMHVLATYAAVDQALYLDSTVVFNRMDDAQKRFDHLGKGRIIWNILAGAPTRL